MRPRVSERALAQIDTALSWVAARSPLGARNIRSRVEAVLELLEAQPLAGRLTSNPRVRRIVVTPYPDLIDDAITADTVIVLRFRHAARRPAH
jgi:plasmid stabilization system protein ParE